MPRKSIIVIFALFVSMGFSQIGSVKIVESEKVSTYDSSKNFLGDSPDLYKGAKLFLPGKSKTLREYGYEDFKSKKESSESGDVYKCCDVNSGFNSNYDSIAGTTFKVLDVEKNEYAATGGGTVDIGESIFTLINLKDSSIAYYKYNSNYGHSFPFIDMRYFDKVKATSLSKSFIVKENSFNLGEKITDINDKVVASVWKYEWKCVDVLIEERYFTLSLLLQNSLGTKMAFEVEDLKDEQFIFSLKKAALYKLKFKTFWDKILQNKVAIGMSPEMVKLTWGEPKKINKTIVSGSVTNQWIYKSGNYVYFTNGLVTAIQ